MVMFNFLVLPKYVMASHYFSVKDHYPSGANCPKPEIWEQEQLKEEYQPELSTETKQVQMVNCSPDSTREERSSKQEGNEESHFTQDPQQLIVSADEVPKEKETTGGPPNSCTDTERVQKSAATACNQKKKADATKPKEKSATVEVLAPVTQPDGDQGIASRCKCLLLRVKRVFTTSPTDISSFHKTSPFVHVTLIVFSKFGLFPR